MYLFNYHKVNFDHLPWMGIFNWKAEWNMRDRDRLERCNLAFEGRIVFAKIIIMLKQDGNGVQNDQSHSLSIVNSQCQTTKVSFVVKDQLKGMDNRDVTRGWQLSKRRTTIRALEPAESVKFNICRKQKIKTNKWLIRDREKLLTIVSRQVPPKTIRSDGGRIPMWRQRIDSVSNKVIDETPVNTKLTTQFVVFFELNIEYRKPWQASRAISVRTSALCRFLGTKRHNEEEHVRRKADQDANRNQSKETSVFRKW